MYFTMNYFRIFLSGKRGSWSKGSGFKEQYEKMSFRYFMVDRRQ